MNLLNKKSPAKSLTFFAIALALLTACGTPAPKTDTPKTVAPARQDTVLTFLQAQKMEMKANALMQTANYELAIPAYTKCIAFLDTVLAQGNNRGLSLYGNEIASICLDIKTAYDSLHQPENSVKYIAESIKWDKLTHNYTGEIGSYMSLAEKLKTIAANAADTAKRNGLCRVAIHYSLAGAAVIDSLRTNDMEDMRYTAYHLTSDIYKLMGNKTEAGIYNKKYKDVYFKIYKSMPNDK